MTEDGFRPDVPAEICRADVTISTGVLAARKTWEEMDNSKKDAQGYCVQMSRFPGVTSGFKLMASARGAASAAFSSAGSYKR
jgi:hypothetical protein